MINVSINEELIRKNFEEVVKEKGEGWLFTKSCEDFITQQLNQYSKFTSNPRPHKYFVFNYFNDDVYYVETEEEAEIQVNKLIEEYINHDLDGKIGYAAVKKVVREFKGEDGKIVVKLQ